MQKRTSPLKFGDLAEKSGLNSVSNLSTKEQLDQSFSGLTPEGELGQKILSWLPKKEEAAA